MSPALRAGKRVGPQLADLGDSSLGTWKAKGHQTGSSCLRGHLVLSVLEGTGFSSTIKLKLARVVIHLLRRWFGLECKDSDGFCLMWLLKISSSSL